MKRFVFLMVLSLSLLLIVGCQPKEITSARVYIQQNDYPAALEQLRIASEKYPDNGYAHLLLGQVYAELDSFQEMNQAFKKALEVDDSYAEEIAQWRTSTAADAFNRGIRHGNRERWDEAIKWYKIATEINPDNSGFWKNLGYSYTQIGDNEKALETYLRALEHEPTDLMITLETASFYLSSGEPEDARRAVELLDAIAEHHPDSASIYIQRGEAFSMIEMPDSAIASFEKAKELDPDNAFVAFRLGGEYYGVGNYDESANNFGKYIEANPDDTSGYFNLMIALTNARRFEDGIKIGKMMTEKFPGFAEGWERYAIMLAQGGKSREATVLGIVALSVSECLKAIRDGDAVRAIAALEEADKTAIREVLPKAVEQAIGDEEVKAKVLEAIK